MQDVWCMNAPYIYLVDGLKKAMRLPAYGAFMHRVSPVHACTLRQEPRGYWPSEHAMPRGSVHERLEGIQNNNARLHTNL